MERDAVAVQDRERLSDVLESLGWSSRLKKVEKGRGRRPLRSA